MQALVWDEGEGLRTAEGPQAVAEAVRSGKSRVWCDITGPGDEEHQFLLGLGFHHLTLEDVQHYTPVPKLEEYTGYHFVVFHALGYDFDRHQVLTPEIHLYVGRNYLIAIHDEMLPPLEEAQHRIRAHPETILGRGIDFLLHTVLDAVIDGYLPLADTWAEKVDALENKLESYFRLNGWQNGCHGGHGGRGDHDDRGDHHCHARGRRRIDAGYADTRHLFARITRSRRALMQLRRRMAHQRDLVEGLMNQQGGLLSDAAIPYFRDLIDHLQRAEEMFESERERLNSLLELGLSWQNLWLAEISTDMNQTMERLTGVATMLMPLTVITGIYGMNFRFMPELESRFGYPAVLLAMAGVGGWIYIRMRRRGWI